MAEAYIIEACRTPVGKRGGGLSGCHPADMGAHVISALLARSGDDPGAMDDVLFGCLDQLGPQAGNIARTAWLAAGLPEHVPGVTIDRQCGSSQQALHFAAQAVMSGSQDLVIAGGVQNMSMVPIAAAFSIGSSLGHDDPFGGSKGWVERYGSQTPSQFVSAERIAERWELDRAAMEQFALESHQRASRAQRGGEFEREIVPLAGLDHDEGVRHDGSLARLASLAPLREGGRLTAALCSQISDAASALLVASERAVKEHGLRPRARVHHMTVLGDDPELMLTAPIAATRRALQRTGLSLEDMDLVEINEAFAAVVLAWQRETGADLQRVNVNGGAIALGHPLGATGARLMTTLLHALEQRGGRYGLQTICEGGGLANLTIIERLD